MGYAFCSLDRERIHLNVPAISALNDGNQASLVKSASVIKRVSDYIRNVLEDRKSCYCRNKFQLSAELLRYRTTCGYRLMIRRAYYNLSTYHWSEEPSTLRIQVYIENPPSAALLHRLRRTMNMLEWNPPYGSRYPHNACKNAL